MARALARRDRRRDHQGAGRAAQKHLEPEDDAFDHLRGYFEHRARVLPRLRHHAGAAGSFGRAASGRRLPRRGNGTHDQGRRRRRRERDRLDHHRHRPAVQGSAQGLRHHHAVRPARQGGSPLPRTHRWRRGGQRLRRARARGPRARRQRSARAPRPQHQRSDPGAQARER